MDSIKYIVSSSLDYEKLICKDAGPNYGKTLGWDILVHKSHMVFERCNLYVIDNRISFEECCSLTKMIKLNPKINFIVKIVDPLFEHRHHYYYEWLLEVIKNKNVRLLTVYEPKEFTAHISSLSVNPAIYIPYPYLEDQELPLYDLAQRKNKIIISGALNRDIYPIRAGIWQKSRRSPSRLFYDVLRHPGYSELGKEDRLHKYIGREYIKYLSKYKFMLVCGSRCKIELLKFHECAYSGCLPVGEAPSSLLEISHIFRMPKINALTLDTLKLILNWEQQSHDEDINILRNFLRRYRNPEKLSNQLLNQF